jgi:hypothetical protein
VAPSKHGDGELPTRRQPKCRVGSRRLVAADDYRNTTNGYTGLRADLAWRAGWSATAIYTLPQQRRPDDRASLARNAVAPDREGFDLVLWGGMLARAHWRKR